MQSRHSPSNLHCPLLPQAGSRFARRDGASVNTSQQGAKIPVLVRDVGEQDADHSSLVGLHNSYKSMLR